jgi:hypothetical protein
MSAIFVDIPAEQFEREFCAEETKEARTFDKPQRKKASNFAAALDALFDVSNCPAELHKGVHVFLNKSLGKAPHEEFFFSEADAGALLPGGDDVTHGSKKKRWTRFWGDFEAWMEVSGKQLGQRVRGYLVTEKQTTITRGARYTSELAQAVVDIERAAEKMRRRRDEAYKVAAREVWRNLPSYVPENRGIKLDAKVKEPRRTSVAGKRSRAMDRFESAAEQLLDENREGGASEVRTAGQRLLEATAKMVSKNLKEVAPDESPASAFKSLFLTAARQLLREKQHEGEAAIDEALAALHVELEALGAEIREESASEVVSEPVETEKSVHVDDASLEDKNNRTERDEAEKARASNFSPNLQKTEEKREFEVEHLDSPVQMSEPYRDGISIDCVDPPFDVGDDSLPEQTEEPRQRIRDFERKTAGRQDVIYAEDFIA